MKIHQILPNLSYADAIGNSVFDLQALFKKWGFESEIFVQTADKKLLKKVFKIHEFDKNALEDTICLYHFSIGAGLSNFLEDLKCKKIIINHNITPPEYMKGLNDLAEHMINVGLQELSEIVKFADLVLCDSEYNRIQVEELGCKRAEVLPVVVNFDRLKKEHSEVIQNILTDDYDNFLHVGRIAPNKKIEDIIKTFYFYKNLFNEKSRLFFIGQFEGMGVEGYHDSLLDLCEELELGGVYFTGKIEQDELNSYYKFCDAFISMSEHEGFCVPLIESMYFDLPILAYNSTAIPYTLDDSGILINKKSYREISKLLSLIIDDDTFRDKIIESQKISLSKFRDFNFEKTLKGYVNGLLNG